MSQQQRIPGWCPLCRSRCGCISIVSDGRLVEVEPYPEHPTGRALCAKGQAAPELVYSADRLLYPMKRTRPKGDPDPGWVRIAWDEALELTAGAMRRISKANGPEGMAFGVTTPSGTGISDSIHWIERLMRAFGSPNDCYATEVCNWHKDFASAYTFGTGVGTPDLTNTGCMLLWGHHPGGAEGAAPSGNSPGGPVESGIAIEFPTLPNLLNSRNRRYPETSTCDQLMKTPESQF